MKHNENYKLLDHKNFLDLKELTWIEDNRITNCLFKVYRKSHLVDVPVAELSRHVNLLGVFVHGEVEVSVEPLQLHMVPVLVI